jgi:glycolate oxidase FAD binding subunit
MTSDISNDIIDALEGAAGEVTVDDTARHGIDGLMARAVAHPVSLRELSLVMSAANRLGWAVAPWGGGTRTSLGNTLERLDVVVDLSRLNRVVEHNPADLTTTVQAGITLARLQEVLGVHGQFLALDPPLPDRATVGGTLAVGASGPLKWQYGSPRDVVIGMKMVQADGVVTKSGGRVVKNVSGYDMARLHIGALGTLGIIAEASFKLTPLPVGEATVVAAYKSTSNCIGAALGIFHSDVMPLALTALDGAAGARLRAMGLTGNGLLAVRLGGRPLTLERQVRECRSICAEHGAMEVEALQGESATGLWRGLADYGWDEGTTPLIGARVSVQPSAVVDIVESVERLESQDGIHAEVVSQPAHGTVLISWYASGNSVSADVALNALGEVRNLAHREGGRMIIERCPPDVKSRVDVWDDVGGPVTVMRRLKELYDPKRVLNPGRYVGGI